MYTPNKATQLSPAAHDAKRIGHVASAATQRPDGSAVVAAHPQLHQLAWLGSAPDSGHALNPVHASRPLLDPDPRG